MNRRQQLRREWRLYCQLNGDIPWEDWNPGMRPARKVGGRMPVTSEQRERHGDKYFEISAAKQVRKQARSLRIEQLTEVEFRWIPDTDAAFWPNGEIQSATGDRWMLESWAHEVLVEAS